jgi:hypothetical protein
MIREDEPAFEGVLTDQYIWKTLESI